LYDSINTVTLARNINDKLYNSVMHFWMYFLLARFHLVKPLLLVGVEGTFYKHWSNPCSPVFYCTLRLKI